MKNIAVFCSAQEVDEKYKEAARQFGHLMGKDGYDLVWGGTDTGLMKVVADAVQSEGGKLYGVTIERFHHLARVNNDELILAKSLGERKAIFLEKCDAVVALIGGVGTFDEMAEVIELRKQEYHKKPIVILNTDGFYDGLKAQLRRMHDEGFLKSSITNIELIDLIKFADTPQEAIDYINQSLN